MTYHIPAWEENQGFWPEQLEKELLLTKMGKTMGGVDLKIQGGTKIDL